MGGGVLDQTTGLDPADLRHPAIQFIGARDVNAHRVGGIAPEVFAAVAAIDVLFEGEFRDRVGLAAVGQASERARQCQRDIA